MKRPSIAFTVYGTAQPKGSARAFLPKGHQFPVVTSDNPKVKGFEGNIRSELQRVMSRTPRAILDEMFSAPIAVTLVFHLPRPKSLRRADFEPTKKPDIDKLCRSALDAMTGVIFRDDAQVIGLGARKRYALTAAKVDVLIESWAPVHTLAVAALLAVKEPHGHTDGQHAS